MLDLTTVVSFPDKVMASDSYRIIKSNDGRTYIFKESAVPELSATMPHGRWDYLADIIFDHNGRVVKNRHGAASANL